MPGTPEEYLADPNTQKAVSMLDEAVSAGKSGEEIVQMLEDSGLRIYTPDSMDDEAAPEEGLEEGLEEEPMMEEGGLEEEPPPMEEEGEEEYESDVGPGIEPKSGEDGGMRGLRIDAVRFGLKKAKEKTDSEEDEEEE